MNVVDTGVQGVW